MIEHVTRPIAKPPDSNYPHISLYGMGDTVRVETASAVAFYTTDEFRALASLSVEFMEALDASHD